MDMHANGTMVGRVDVYGGYIGSTVLGQVWQQLVTSTSMPSGYATSANPYVDGGFYELRIAASNPNVLYGVYTGAATSGIQASKILIVSQDGGQTWKNTNFPIGITADSNGNFRYTCGQFLAIDPNNAAIAYFADPTNGIYLTTNGLSGSPTWTKVSVSLPTLSNQGICAIVFDPTSGTTGGATNRLVFGVYGVGVYVTTNAGGSWSLISGSPTNPGHGKCGPDGTIYWTQGDGSTVWRYTTAGVLTNITPDTQGYPTIVCDPNDATRVICDRGGCYLNVPTSAVNSGTPTWGGVNFAHAISAGAGQPGWQQASNDTYITDGEMWFDPLSSTSTTSNTIGTGSKSYAIASGLNVAVGEVLRFFQTGTPANSLLLTVTAYNPSTGAVSGTASNPKGSGTISNWTVGKERLWFAWGCGVLYTDGPFLTSGTQVWHAQATGIENLVVNDVVWPPGGNPIMGCWDRPIWNLANPNANQPGYWPQPYTGVVVAPAGLSVDFAKSDPTFLVGLVDGELVYSSNSGMSWTAATQTPGAYNSGAIAATDTQHMVVAQVNGVWYTSNTGSTWTQSTGISGSGNVGAGAKCIAADGVIPGKFYITSGGSAYVSTNYGASFASTGASALPSANYLTRIKSVYGQAGHLFWCTGPTADLGTTHPVANTSPYFSLNGGTTWTAIPNVLEVIDIDIGAVPSGGSYGSVYLVGWVNPGSGYQYGVWRCDNFNTAMSGLTWTQMTEFVPRLNIDPSGGGWLDCPTCIAANPNRSPGCVVGYQGSSCAYFGPASGY